MWIADLFKFDIVASGYIPVKEIHKLRELFRYCYKLVNERSSEKMRLQNALTVSKIALDSVFQTLSANLLPPSLAMNFPMTRPLR